MGGGLPSLPSLSSGWQSCGGGPGGRGGGKLEGEGPRCGVDVGVLSCGISFKMSSWLLSLMGCIIWRLMKVSAYLSQNNTLDLTKIEFCILLEGLYNVCG